MTTRPDSAPLDSEPERDVLTDLSGKPLRRAMSAVTIAWLFGAVWMHAIAGSPLTVFASKLGCSNFEFGLLAAMPFVAALLSLPASVLIDRSGRRDTIFFLGLYPNRLLWFPMALLPIWVITQYGWGYSPVAIFLFLAFTFLLQAGQGIGGPAWVSWMADVVPDRVRGRYFARRRQLGILTAIPAALVAGWAVDRYALAPGASNLDALWVCAIIFMIAATFGLVDIAAFHLVPHARRPKPRMPLLKMLLHPLKNHRFLWFSAGTATLWFAVAGQGQFVNKYLVDQLHLKGVEVQLMVLVGPMLAQLIVLPIWGKTIDRYGKKPAMLIAILGLVPIGIGWVFMHGGHIWLGYLLGALGAALWTGVEVANFNLVIELSGTDSDPKSEGGGGTAYVAINTVIVNIAGCLGGLFYGTIAEYFSWMTAYDTGIAWLSSVSFYHVVFAVSAILRLAAVFPMLRVHEPEAEPTLDALRFMAGNLYNNVAGAVMLPVRLFRAKEDEPQ